MFIFRVQACIGKGGVSVFMDTTFPCSLCSLLGINESNQVTSTHCNRTGVGAAAQGMISVKEVQWLRPEEISALAGSPIGRNAVLFAGNPIDGKPCAKCEIGAGMMGHPVLMEFINEKASTVTCGLILQSNILIGCASQVASWFPNKQLSSTGVYEVYSMSDSVHR